MCKPQKVGGENLRTIRDEKLSIGHSEQLKEARDGTVQ